MRARPWLLIVGLAALALFAWWYRSRTGDGAPATAGSRDAGSAPTTSAVRTLSPLPEAPRRVLPPPAMAFDATVRHSVDPCTAVVDPVLPQGYEQVTAAGITVAWNPVDATGPVDAPLRPIALAHLVAGLLEEAAQLTGTERRTQLAVIVDASHDDFVARTKTPPWVAGLYDGGAVRLYLKGTEDLAVALATLRHEVMHAQLHATVGCMPFWFNEGLAQYFAGTPPVRDWLTMLRTGEPFELATVDDPTILDLKADNAARMYAVSLAMILYLVEHGGEPALREALRVAQAIDSPRAAAELWERLHPRVGYRAVLDALAQKLFGLPTGPELDLAFRGAICCSGIRNASELACRGAPARQETSWSDTSTTPRMFCRSRW